MQLLNRVGRVSERVRWLKPVFGWAYLQVRQRASLAPLYRALARELGGRKHFVVFDVGANDAGSGIAYARAFPRAVVHLFEAHPAVAAVARKRIAAAGLEHRAFLHEWAVSDVRGTAAFHVSSELGAGDWRVEVSDSSSLLEPTGHKEHFANVAFSNILHVPTRRLDEEIRSGELPQPDFLHLDVQGAELMVLSGLGECLAGVRVIWLEVGHVELYAGQPLAADVQQVLKAAGFALEWERKGEVQGDQLWVAC